MTKPTVGVAAPLISVLLVATGSYSLSLEKVWERGEDGIEFGLITKVLPTTDGGVVVLDETGPGFVWLGQDGALKADQRRDGRGPGEFEIPNDLALDPEGNVVISDAAVGRLSWFSLSADSAAYQESWTPPFNVRGMCYMGDDLVMLALDAEGNSLHIFGKNRDLNLSFGLPVEEAAHAPAMAFVNGDLLCLPQENLIVYLPRHIGAVYAFSPTGELMWRSPIPDYVQVGLESGPGWVRYTAEEGYHSAGAAVTAVGEFLVVQHGRVDRRDPKVEELEDVETTLLSLPTGRVVLEAPRLPRIGAARDEIAFGFTNSPWPVVQKYSVVNRE